MTKRPIPSSSMSVQDLAQHFNCSVSTIWRWEKSGVIPHSFKIGGLTRWRRAEIEALTASETAA